MLQGIARLFEDFVLPHQELGAEVFALALAHEGLFVGWAIAVQAVNSLVRQPVAVLLRHSLLLLFLPQHSSATPCHRDHRSSRGASLYPYGSRPTTTKSVVQGHGNVQCSMT